MSQSNRFALILAMLVLSCLCGCGKSKSDREYEAAKCEAWSDGFGYDLMSQHPSLFAVSVDEQPMNPGEIEAWAAMAQTYEPGGKPPIGPDVMKAAMKDGMALFQTEKQNNDLAGEISFDKECIDNYYSLTANQ